MVPQAARAGGCAHALYLVTTATNTSTAATTTAATTAATTTATTTATTYCWWLGVQDYPAVPWPAI